MNKRASPCSTQLSAADFYRAQAYDPAQSVGYLMRRVLSGFLQEIEAELEPSGLTSAQWLPLFKLARGKGCTAAEMARVCELDAGATTRLLDRLEDKGLIQRERSEEDRRVVNLSLTREGKQAAKVVPEVLSCVHNGALAGFTPEEWETLKSLLRRMLANLDSMNASRTAHDN